MKSEAIKEESSEKRKRGRPRIYPEKLIRQILRYEDAKTERGAIENLLTGSSIVSIVDAWKADPAGTAWGEYYFGKDGNRPRIFHKSILAALGRIENKEDRLTSARIIAERKTSTRFAVALIRHARLGREDKPDFLNLVRNIEKALNSYLAAHPSTPKEMVVRALQELAETIE
jgi:hypothetical protein